MNLIFNYTHTKGITESFPIQILSYSNYINIYPENGLGQFKICNFISVYLNDLSCYCLLAFVKIKPHGFRI